MAVLKPVYKSGRINLTDNNCFTIEKVNQDKCKCFNPPFNFQDYTSKFLGFDKTNGRFGKVSIDTCNICGRKWLHIMIEDEALPESGRWCRGLITDVSEKDICPENVEKILENLEWYYIGGSYYNSMGTIALNKFKYDL